MRVSPIRSPLSGEHLAATSPVMRPEVSAAWQRRIHYWTGRSLTADALDAEQENRGARLAWHGRVVTPGVVRGLDVGLISGPATAAPTLAQHFVRVLPGHGFTLTGEDVVVPRETQLELGLIPVVRFDAQGAVIPPAPNTPESQTNLGNGAIPPAETPWAAVLVLRPAAVLVINRRSLTDPCEVDPESGAFSDARLADAARFRLCIVPFTHLPPTQGTDTPHDATWRNRVAWRIFNAEAEAQAQVIANVVFPWENVGLPLALISFEPGAATGTVVPFMDRATVVRAGGQARFRRRPATARPGRPTLWYAQFLQFSEQLSQLPASVTGSAAALAARFRQLPPAGLVPRSTLNFLTTAQALAIPNVGPPDRAGSSGLFPPTWGVRAAPVPEEDLNAIFAACAPLAPFDLRVTPANETVLMLVPVPQRLFDPHLLLVELPDRRIETELHRLVAVRQHWRQRRDYLRIRRDALHQLIVGATGFRVPVEIESGQLEPEPTETAATLPLTDVLLSPTTSTGTAELRASVVGSPAIGGLFREVYFELHLDEEAPPQRVEMIWNVGAQQRLAVFEETPAPPPARIDPATGRPAEIPLWRRYGTRLNQLNPIVGALNGFVLRIIGGRAALGRVVAIFGTANPNVTQETIWWHHGISNGTVQSPEGEWRVVSSENLLAPHEDRYKPLLPNDEFFNTRLHEIEAYPNSGSAGTIGLDNLANRFEASADRADDAISLNFYRTQAHVHRIRQVMLGEDAANDLLTSPSLNNVIKTKSALVAQDRLTQAFLKARRAPAESIPSPGPIAAVGSFGSFGANERLNPNFQIEAKTPFEFFAPKVAVNAPKTKFNVPLKDNLGAAVVDDVIKAEPIVGQPFDLRTVTIGKRFEDGPVRTGFNSALSGLQEVIQSIATLELPWQNEGGASTLSGSDLRDPAAVGLRLRNPNDLISAFLRPRLAAATRAAFDAWSPTVEMPVTLRALLIADLNVQITGPSLWNPARFQPFEIRSEITTLVQSSPTGTKLARLNRLLLEAAYPRAFVPIDEELPELQRVVQGAQIPFTYTALFDSVTRASVIGSIFWPAISANDQSQTMLSRALRITDTAALILRRAEFYVSKLRRRITRIREAAEAARVQRDAAARRIFPVEGKLAEARHDVGVARALWQEEQERVADLNRVRDDVIANQVRYLAFVRPRTVTLSQPVAGSWLLDRADAPAPVPECLLRHDDAPDPLEAYVRLFRHSPARWFKAIGRRLREFDTREKLSELLIFAQASALRFASERAGFADQAGPAAVKALYLGGFNVLGQFRQRAVNFPVAQARFKNWAEHHRDAEEIVSLGDLTDGRHAHGRLAADAAAELDRFQQVATCLHAEFAGVPPAVRLEWVERFSEFDRPTSLRDITHLPRFGTLSRNTRRRLQAFVDWLFDRVTDEPAAGVLVNDLVRICLLLASHAPVSRIIGGHVPKPVPIRPGIQIPIRPLNPALVRVGMEFHVWDQGRVVARGAVENLHEGEVTARVQQHVANVTTLQTTMQIQFVAPALSRLKKLS